ncbi:MAG: type III-A CRISPR-associated protein Cas10/Csm1 [Blastocatellia bacterium]|nr:type III-A CRISPR-associated protein Cas10/Csm1 [Blastocatellia bacterium]
MENLERDVLAYQALTYSLKLFCERNKLDYWQKLKLAFSTNFKQNLETDSKLVEKATKLVEQFSSVRDSSIPHLPAITNSIRANRNGSDDEAPNDLDKYFYPLKALELSEQIFPQVIDSKQNYDKEFAELWSDFSHESAQLPTANLNVYLSSFVYLIHKYFWCLSATASNKQYLGFSLYEQCRISAALAACFYELEQAKKAGESIKVKDLLIIEGDISGIQKFIYNPAFNGQELQDGIARRLRGRSFYLNLLLKTLTDYLIGELKLYNFNALWATGGHFLIIAPNTQTAKKQLDNARENIQKWLWKEFRGALGLIMTDVEVASSELKDFSEIRKEISDKSAKLKLQQFAIPLNFGDNKPDEAWQDPWVLRMQDNICRDTGRDMSEEEVKISEICQSSWQEDKEISPRSRQSLQFDRIGQVLIKAKSLQLRRVDEWNIADRKNLTIPKTAQEAKWSFSSRQWLIEFADLNRCWLLTDEIQPKADAELFLQIANHKNLKIKFLSSNQNIVQGFEFLADAVATKEEDNNLVDFHELAERADGAKFLGVLRMDVDSLGYLFAKGFPKEDKSIAKIANLSRMLDMFFTGYLNTLVAGKNLYTTYAGGDDLFIVGAWNEVVELAETINERFAAYCTHNPAMHISGGIALCKGKYPIGRAAEKAGELLDGKAKKVEWKDKNGKKQFANALGFMGQGVLWEDWKSLNKSENSQKPSVVETVKLLTDDSVSANFIYNLLALHRQHVKSSSDKINTDLILFPKFIYSLVRNIKDHKLRYDIQEAIGKQWKYVPVIASYTALKRRKTNEKIEQKEKE